MFCVVVGEIEVVCLCWVFGVEGVDLFDDGVDIVFLVFLVYGVGGCVVDLSDVFVVEVEFFGFW